MKKIAFLAIVCAFSATLYAAEGELRFLRNSEIRLLVNDVVDGNRDLGRIIAQYGVTIEKSNIDNTRKAGDYTLYVPQSRLDEVVSKIEQLGVIELKKIESINYGSVMSASDYDLEYLTGQKEFYRKELEKNDTKSDSYKEFFNKERDLDRQIYEKNKEIGKANSNVSYSVIELSLFEKSPQDLDSRDDFSDFINMPGFESKYFRLENRGQDAASDQYLGGSLRYMFTKGRSYFLIGVMKPFEDKADAPGAIDDIVSWGLGKDFYPRYLGQGKNTFFNPFSGFEIGGMVLTSADSIDHMFTLEPHIGVELFKNKYFIIDTRVSYLFPLDKEKIKEFRGLTHNLSINFVF